MEIAKFTKSCGAAAEQVVVVQAKKLRVAGDEPAGGYGPLVGPYGGAVGKGLKYDLRKARFRVKLYVRADVGPPAVKCQVAVP